VMLVARTAVAAARQQNMPSLATPAHTVGE
jgi:hypothetical protein